MFELLTSNVPKYLRVSMAKGGIAKGIFTAFFKCPSRQPKIIIKGLMRFPAIPQLYINILSKDLFIKIREKVQQNILKALQLKQL